MVKNWLEIIPRAFWKGYPYPTAKTVGQLIKQLERLPRNLPVETTFTRGVRLVVYNIEDKSRHLEIGEI